MTEKGGIITIDGPSGAGKSTISRMLAEKLGYTYLDTGAMYRAVGLKIERAGLDLDNTEALETLLRQVDLRLEADGADTLVYLDGEEVTDAIRTPEMGLVASRVSAHAAVRARLTSLQRQMGDRGGVVAEGRDMGTVVFPNADCKFYLDATPEERARRRREQLLENGREVEYQDILDQIIKRDHDDSQRTLAPLKAADDAVIVDSSTMDTREVVAFMLQYCKRLSSGT